MSCISTLWVYNFEPKDVFLQKKDQSPGEVVAKNYW